MTTLEDQIKAATASARAKHKRLRRKAWEQTVRDATDMGVDSDGTLPPHMEEAQLRLIDGMKWADVGDRYGVSAERVRQRVVKFKRTIWGYRKPIDWILAGVDPRLIVRSIHWGDQPIGPPIGSVIHSAPTTREA